MLQADTMLPAVVLVILEIHKDVQFNFPCFSYPINIKVELISNNEIFIVDWPVSINSQFSFHNTTSQQYVSIYIRKTLNTYAYINIYMASKLVCYSVAGLTPVQ